MKIFNIDKRIMWSKDLYLRNPSRDLTENEVKSADFKELINYMFEALYENDIGVGLAAPQVGLMINLVVIDIKRNGKSPIVMVNPKYVPETDEKIESRETCLSFDSVCGVVSRFKKIKVIAKDVFYNNIEFTADSFLSMVCQHEIDHLNGNVYIDKAEIGELQKHEKVLASKAVNVIYSN